MSKGHLVFTLLPVESVNEDGRQVKLKMEKFLQLLVEIMRPPELNLCHQRLLTFWYIIYNFCKRKYNIGLLICGKLLNWCFTSFHWDGCVSLCTLGRDSIVLPVNKGVMLHWGASSQITQTNLFLEVTLNTFCFIFRQKMKQHTSKMEFLQNSLPNICWKVASMLLNACNFHLSICICIRICICRCPISEEEPFDNCDSHRWEACLCDNDKPLLCPDRSAFVKSSANKLSIFSSFLIMRYHIKPMAVKCAWNALPNRSLSQYNFQHQRSKNLLITLSSRISVSLNNMTKTLMNFRSSLNTFTMSSTCLDKSSVVKTLKRNHLFSSRMSSAPKPGVSTMVNCGESFVVHSKRNCSINTFTW